jgi:YHS domain-containing protein
MIRVGLCLVFAALHLVAVQRVGQADHPPERTLSFDAMELIAGREVPGTADLAVLHEGIEYRFATEENKAAFEKAPAQFEVADGGACGRMGPLAGLGDARRYVVHEGRIFFFASDACRDSFVKNPARFIETADPRPAGTPEQADEARKRLHALVDWAGGAERFLALSTYRESASRKEVAGGREWSVVKHLAARFPDCFLVKDSWDEIWFSTVRGPQGALMASAEGRERIAASRMRAFDRSLARSLLVIIKSSVEAKTHAESVELLAFADGTGFVGDTPVDYVRVWKSGALSRLAIEQGSGRPVQLSFRGRDGTSTVGDSVRTYTAYQTVKGVRLPTSYTVNFDGKEIPAAGISLDGFEINPDLPGDTFSMNE